MRRIVLPRRPGTCYPLTQLGSVCLFTQLLMKPLLGRVAVLQLQTYLLQRVFLQECVRSPCVFSCMYIPGLSCLDTVVNEEMDDK